MTGKVGFKKATRTEVVKVNDMLKEVLVKLEDGHCSYIDGHSDESVAREIGCSAASVAGIRKELFGNLIIRTKENTDDKRINELIQLTENLTKCYAELKLRYNDLILMLALNKVVDCRHLVVK